MLLKIDINYKKKKIKIKNMEKEENKIK